MLPFRLRSQFTMTGARNFIAGGLFKNGYCNRQERKQRKTLSAQSYAPLPFNAQSSLVCRRFHHECSSRQHDLRIFRSFIPPHVLLSSLNPHQSCSPNLNSGINAELSRMCRLPIGQMGICLFFRLHNLLIHSSLKSSIPPVNDICPIGYRGRIDGAFFR